MLDVKKLLTKILTQITASTTFGTASGSPSSSLCRIVKVGNVVHISGFYRRTSNITTTETLFTIPSGYRPSATVQLPSRLTDANNNISYYCNLYTDGTIRQMGGSAMREVFFCGTYTL